MLNFKKIALVFVIVVSILSTGCWNYREIEKLAIVAGVSIDKNLSKSTYEVSVEIINPTSSKSQTKMTSQLYSSEGKTVFDAIRNLILVTGKRLYWSHAKVVIISDSIASEGIARVIDWFNRDSEVRPNMWLLITKTGSASSILNSKAVEEDIVSFHLDEIMKSQNPIYKFPEMDIWRFRKELSSKTEAAVAPTVKLEIKKEKISLQVSGTDVFKGDKAVGWLNERETFNFLFIRGKVKGGLILLKSVEDTNTDVALEIFGSNVKITPLFDGNSLSINIDVKSTVAIDELDGNTDFINGPRNRKLEEDAEKALKRELESTVKRVQKDYKSDIFDFGSAIKRRYPKLWKKIQPNYMEIFSKLHVNVNVDLTIKGSAKNSKPIEIGD